MYFEFMVLMEHPEINIHQIVKNMSLNLGRLAGEKEREIWEYSTICSWSMRADDRAEGKRDLEER